MTPEQLQEKTAKEQEVVDLMITMFCNKKHGSAKGSQCERCAELAEYAKSRSAHCPFMAEKTFCSNCKVHCYKPEMRERIREVMRYSGPRMLTCYPGKAMWHVVTSRREKRRVRKEERAKKREDVER